MKLFEYVGTSSATTGKGLTLDGFPYVLNNDSIQNELLQEGVRFAVQGNNAWTFGKSPTLSISKKTPASMIEVDTYRYVLPFVVSAGGTRSSSNLVRPDGSLLMPAFASVTTASATLDNNIDWLLSYWSTIDGVRIDRVGSTSILLLSSTVPIAGYSTPSLGTNAVYLNSVIPILTGYGTKHCFDVAKLVDRAFVEATARMVVMTD